MKKAISIVLSIVLILCTLSASINSVYANDTDVDLGEMELFAKDWFSYGEGAKIGEGSNAGTPLFDYKIYNSANSSVKYSNMSGKVFATKLDGILAGRSYELSFKYKGEFSASSQQYNVCSAGVYKYGDTIGTNGSLAGNTAIATAEDAIVTDTTVWNDCSFCFTATGDELYLAVQVLNAGDFWVDDFTITLITQDDLNIPESWVAAAPSGYDTATKTAVADTTIYYPNTTSDKKESIKFTGWINTTKIAVKPLKKYTLSFYWYATYESANEDSSTALSENRTYRFPRFVIQGGNDTEYSGTVFDNELLLTSNDHTVAKYGCSDGCGGWVSSTKTFADAKNWNYYECDFYSLNNTSVYIWFNSNGIYFDDIKFNEYGTDFSIMNFEANGGQPVAPISLKAGTEFALPKSTRPQNEFLGWYTDEDLTTMFELNENSKGVFPSESITLYAKWANIGGWGTSQKTQSFDTWQTFVDNYVSGTGCNTITELESNDTLKVVDNSVYYKNTKSWGSVDSEGIIVNPGTSKTADRSALNNENVLPNGGKLEITFWYKGVTGSTQVWFEICKCAWNLFTTSYTTSSKVTLTSTGGEWKKQTLTINVPTVDNSASDVCMGLILNLKNTAGTFSTTSCELYVDDISIQSVDNTTVSFETNNGLDISPITAQSGDSLTLPTPTVKTNKVFDGWYSDEALTQEFTAAVQPNNDITLYAKWVESSTSEIGVVTAFNSKGAIRAESETKKQGLRIYHSIDKDWIESAGIKQYGIIAIRSAKLTENGYSELNLESIAAVSPKSRVVAWDSTNKPTPTLWNDSKEQYIFTSALTGIKEKYYNSDYAVRTYAIADDNTVYYGDTYELSVYDVVNAILNNTSSTDPDYLTAKDVIGKANALKETNSEIVSYNQLNPETLKVHNTDSAVVNATFEGLNIIHQLYTRMPDVYNRVYNDEQIKLENNTLKNMGIKKIRSFYGSSLSYDARSKTHDFSKNSEYLEAFIQSCLDMQKMGIEVGITPQYGMQSFFKSGYTPSASSSKVSIYNAGYIAFEEDGVTVDLDATNANFAKFVADSVTYFRARGVNNIEEMFCFTEVNNVLSGLGSEYWTSTTSTTTFEKRNYERLKPVFKGAILAVDKGLKDAGLRSSYKIVAPCDNWRLDDVSSTSGGETSTISTLVNYCISDSELLNAVDIIGSHKGYATGETFEDKEFFYSHPSSANSQSIAISKTNNKPFYIDEYNVDSSVQYGAETFSANRRILKSEPMMGVALGAMTNGLLNSGISSTYIWSLYDQQWPNHISEDINSEFSNGVQVVGYLPTYLESYTPRAPWYSLSLLTRYIGVGKVYSTEKASSNIYISAIKRSDNNEFTIIVTNYEDVPKSIKVNLDSTLNGAKLYRYVYDANAVNPTSAQEMNTYDSTINNVEASFLDLTPAKSVVIYTTESPETLDN